MDTLLQCDAGRVGRRCGSGHRCVRHALHRRHTGRQRAGHINAQLARLELHQQHTNNTAHPANVSPRNGHGWLGCHCRRHQFGSLLASTTPCCHTQRHPCSISAPHHTHTRPAEPVSARPHHPHQCPHPPLQTSVAPPPPFHWGQRAARHHRRITGITAGEPVGP